MHHRVEAAPDTRIRRGRVARAFAALAMAWLSFGASADLVIPPGGSESLSSGAMDLACTDVIVGGTLNLDSGSLLNVRHLTIQSGGTINGGTGSIQLGGDWQNAGTFAAGGSTVRFADLCGLTSAAIGGSTTFFDARFVSAIGKSYVFAVGTTQTIGGVLEIAGTTPNPIPFRSATPGQVASLNLLPAGTQQIQHVGVTDVWATGQWLAPSLTNEGGGGNANRWFGQTPVVADYPVPTLGDMAMLMLAALLAAMGALDLRRRARRARRV